jgi:hypothetical protein
MRAMVDAPPRSNTFWKSADARGGRVRAAGARGTMHSSPMAIEAHSSILAANQPALRTAMGLPCSEFQTDPAIPQHATWDQLVKATESVLYGDSDRVDVIKEGVKSKLQKVLPAAEMSDHLCASQGLETIKKGQPDLTES